MPHKHIHHSPIALPLQPQCPTHISIDSTIKSLPLCFQSESGLLVPNISNQNSLCRGVLDGEEGGERRRRGEGIRGKRENRDSQGTRMVQECCGLGVRTLTGEEGKWISSGKSSRALAPTALTGTMNFSLSDTHTSSMR